MGGSPLEAWIPADDRGQQAVIAFAAIARITTGGVLGTAMAVFIGREGTPFAVSLAWVAFALGTLLFAPVWGAVADVTGRRRTVLVGTAFLSALSLVPLVVSQAVWVQIGIRGLYAVFAAGYRAVILTIVSERGGDAGRGRSLGVYNSAASVGGIGSRVLAGFLLGMLAPSALYLLVSAGSLVAASVTLLILDPTPTPARDVSLGTVGREIRRRLLPAAGRRSHLSKNGLGWLYVAVVLRNMTEKGLVSVVPIFLVADVGVTEFLMGVILAISPALRVGFMYLFGRVSDRVGRKPLIAGGLAGSGIQALLLAAAVVPASLALRAGLAGSAFVVHALTISALTIGSIAFIGDVAPVDRESELMGLRSTARGVGGVVGPLLVGTIATVTSYQTAFLSTSLFAFLAVGVVVAKVIESHSTDADLGRPAGAED